MTKPDPVVPGPDGRLPAMSIAFREEEVDLSLLPEDCRELGTGDFVRAVTDLYGRPYEDHDGSFSTSYTEGLFEITWIPLGDPGTEMMTIETHLEEGRTEEAVALLEELLEREPDHQRARTALTMIRLGFQFVG